MRTIADSYRDQYYGIGIQQGIEKTAIKMLKEGAEVEFVVRVTGLSSDEILKLKNNS